MHGATRMIVKTLQVSEISSVHHQEFFTVHTAMVYVIQLASRIRTDLSWSCSQAVSKPVWHITLLYVQWKTPDDGQRKCPKLVEFYSKNKIEEPMHLVGFIIRIYHDAWSSERQILYFILMTPWQEKTCYMYWYNKRITYVRLRNFYM